MPEYWSKPEKEFVIMNADKLTDKQLRNNLNSLFKTKRKTVSVRKFRQRLGIRKKSGRGRCELDIDPNKDNTKDQS